MSNPDEPPGGSPACYLGEVDLAYAGYLTDTELGAVVVQLLARERGALDLIRGLRARTPVELLPVESLPVAEPLLTELADQFAVAARLLAAAVPAHGDPPAARFAGSADSPDPLVQVAEVAAALVRDLEALLPRIASNACHDALNRVLALHRDQLARLPRG
jgi:hypothetical protein